MTKTVKKVLIVALFGLGIIGSYMIGFNTGTSNIINENIKNVTEKDNLDNKNEESDNYNNVKGELDYNKIVKNISRLEDLINKQYLNEYSIQDLEIGIYKGMLESLDDPYTVYYDAEEFKALNESSSGEFGGVGIQVNSKDNYIEVIAPIKGTPAEKAGILPGDIITHINDEPFTGSQMEEAVKVMRGNPGESVKLTISRGQNTARETLDFTIVRAIISVESVHTEMLDGNIGYILLTAFQEHSAEDFEAGIKELKDQGAQKFILDLRNNPGGLLDVAMDIADILMDEGIVISVRDKNGNSNEYKTVNGSEKFEMITLINEGSASASEVLSGALKENGRSKLVGENTYGKGVIQQIYPMVSFAEGEGLKITVAEFYTPLGNKIHGVGIAPDYEIKIPEGITQIGVDNLKDDTQLQKAIELLK